MSRFWRITKLIRQVQKFISIFDSLLSIFSQFSRPYFPELSSIPYFALLELLTTPSSRTFNLYVHISNLYAHKRTSRIRANCFCNKKNILLFGKFASAEVHVARVFQKRRNSK